MATAKKTVKKPAAAKKPVAKTAAAKKPAAKKAPVKKSAVKKPATKVAATKTASAKAAVKKPAAKKTATKVAATKVTATKAAAVKPSAKKAPAKVAATKVTATKAAAVKKTETQALDRPAETADPNVKYKDLFEAFTHGKLPFSQGYIVSSFFSETSAYSIYEIVSYAGVKEIFQTGDGLQFITGGKKLHILVQPDTYHFKPVEPVSRAEGERIPKRFNELEEFVTKNQSRIYVAKEPVETYGSFTILTPQGINFAVVFYQLPDLNNSLEKFFEESLNRQRKIPQSDAKKVALYIVDVLKKNMGFEGEYS